MKKVPCKAKKFYILLPFLIITVAFLTAVSIYYYLIKYRAKQKHFCITTPANLHLKYIIKNG